MTAAHGEGIGIRARRLAGCIIEAGGRGQLPAIVSGRAGGQNRALV
jgi:hypothetical protein